MKEARGWRHLKLYFNASGDCKRDHLRTDDADVPAIRFFIRSGGGTIRHFWAEQTAFDMADPGQDPRGAVVPTPLWNVLDETPEGRGGDWCPKLVDLD